MSARIQFLLFLFLLSVRISNAQDLSGCWSGTISSDQHTTSVLIFIEQDKFKGATTRPILANTFKGVIINLKNEDTSARLKIKGKITMKGIMIEEESPDSTIIDSLIGSLKISKLKFDPIDTIEVLRGTWDANENSILRNVNLNRCKPLVQKAQEPVTVQPRKKKYKTNAELKRDSSGQVIEALNRKVKKGSSVLVKSKEFTILIQDNRNEDGDSLTIIFNNKIVLHHYEVKKTPFSLTLQFDESIPQNTLIFHADNLGRIPPNTSVISVFVNNKKIKEVNVLSNLEGSDILYLTH